MLAGDLGATRQETEELVALAHRVWTEPALKVRELAEQAVATERELTAQWLQQESREESGEINAENTRERNKRLLAKPARRLRGLGRRG